MIMQETLKIIFYLLYLTPSFILTVNIVVQQSTFNVGEDITILYTYLDEKSLTILGVKNTNPISRIIKLRMFKITPVKNGDFTLTKISAKKFKDIKLLKKYLQNYKVEVSTFNDNLYGGYITFNHKKRPVINYSKLEKVITFNNTKYTITQQRIGNINKLHQMKTGIIISMDNKPVFQKQYPFLIPFSFSEINKIPYIHICSIEIGLIRSALQYIFNKGLAMKCYSINLNTLKEEKLITTYFDPNEFGNIMRAFPLLYVLPTKNSQIDKIVAVLHKKKMVLNLCKSGTYKCNTEKKMEIPIEFPKIVHTSSTFKESDPVIILIYQNKIQLITLKLSEK